ncbi:molybdopterin molybdotransferase MoeA [Ideonella livida]|uniref:Molybdopterin molybdenumtransferase n=1 Tax=Ideonella livida TaxID=2707176 RepID=A0A7C9PFT7_9BURK|nr:gephyrin-like molybdotransferase Glp [Ideonella livida]NDY90609.1 molybdopterin molybdotransferase MoeA [Ideonella livida]
MAETLASSSAAPRGGLLSLDEVLLRLTAAARPHRIQALEDLDTFEALGRVLAQDLVSTLDVPPADNTSMDGYALRAADVPAPGTVLPVSQRIAAGHPGQALQPGTAARIFTGAQVPPGANCVVMQEACEALPDAAGTGGGLVRVLQVPTAGQWVRRRGEDVCQGGLVLPAGCRITPQALGLAATVGAARLQVVRRPRVALFSTGDELVMPGQPLPPGAIYNSNRYTLRGLLQAAGCEVTDLGIVPDRLDATRQALRRAADGHDLILTSGGVSVGEEDHLRPAAQAEGHITLWQMATKPGKPLAFGSIRRTRDDGEALLMGLPGNPVSSFVTFLLTVAPVLRVMQGGRGELPAAMPMTAAFSLPKADKRREFLRVRLNAQGQVEAFGNQSSGVLTSAVWADGLVDNPAGQAILPGDTVRYLPLSALIGN